MSELHEGTVVLHTGEHSVEPVLDVVATGLRSLPAQGLSGLLALSDLVALARDPEHRMTPRSMDLCERTGLVSDGKMEPTLAATVRASVQGPPDNLSFVDPLTGA